MQTRTWEVVSDFKTSEGLENLKGGRDFELRGVKDKADGRHAGINKLP